METKKKKQKFENPFCPIEMYLTEDILNVLEFDVETKNNFILSCCGIPLDHNGKKLVKMCYKTQNIDSKKYTYFRPLKKIKDIMIIVDYIHEYEYPNPSLVSVTETRNEDGVDRTYYKGILKDGDNDILSETSFQYTNELEAKFATLYLYFYGNEEELIKKLGKVRYYNYMYRKTHPVNKKKRGKRDNGTTKKAKKA